MRSSYKEIFRVQCRHEYFRSGLWEAMTWEPSPQTAVLMRRARCLFRSIAGGLVMLCEAEQDASTLSIPLTDALPLTFILRAPKPQWSAFTDAEPQPGTSSEDTLLYFNNLQDYGTQNVDARQLHMLNSAETPLQERSFPIRPPAFRLPLKSPVTSASLQLFNVLGVSVWNSVSSAAQLSQLELNFSGVPEGRYRLQMNGADLFEFYLTALSPQPYCAIVDIFPGGPAMSAVPEPCRPVAADGQSFASVSFAIALPTRNSIWRYHVVSQSPEERAYSGYEVIGGPPRGAKGVATKLIAFHAPVAETLRGQAAWAFESLQPIPLLEYPADRFCFELAKSGGTSGQTRIALPFADAERTRMERTAKGQSRLVSEIYVHL